MRICRTLTEEGLTALVLLRKRRTNIYITFALCQASFSCPPWKWETKTPHLPFTLEENEVRESYGKLENCEFKLHHHLRECFPSSQKD